MNLHDVNTGIKKNKKRTRIGRGPGSGQGKTSGRGHKGQGQLAGWSAPAIFEGGRTPVIRRVPKRGFNNQWARSVFALNVGDLEQHFNAGDEVSVSALYSTGLVKGQFDVIKILGDGELSKALKVSAHRFSKSALDKIKQAGGDAITLAGPKPVVKNKQGKVAK